MKEDCDIEFNTLKSFFFCNSQSQTILNLCFCNKRILFKMKHHYLYNNMTTLTNHTVLRIPIKAIALSGKLQSDVKLTDEGT